MGIKFLIAVLFALINPLVSGSVRASKYRCIPMYLVSYIYKLSRFKKNNEYLGT